MKKNSEEIEEALQEMYDNLSSRLSEVLGLLSLDEAA
jgi:hypothetical protein